MVRPKKNVFPMDRINKEILSSPCFRNIRALHGEKGYWKFCNSKITPI
jgi:hypothetical protein